MSADLFGPKPRQPRRVMMHVIDAGNEVAKFQCVKCMNETGWLRYSSVTEAKRGIPCPKCNEEKR